MLLGWEVLAYLNWCHWKRYESTSVTVRLYSIHFQDVMAVQETPVTCLSNETSFSLNQTDVWSEEEAQHYTTYYLTDVY